MSPKLALGAAQFGLDYGISNTAGQVRGAEVQAILRHAAGYGLNTIDTAIGYGNSEEVLGRNDLSPFNIITKLPPVPDSEPDIAGWVRQSIEGSLGRLNIQSLGGILLHDPESLLTETGRECWNALESMKRERLVSKLGISIYSPSLLENIQDQFQLDIVQSPLNPLDSRLSKSGWLERLAEAGTEIHIRSVFMQGLLLMSSSERPSYFEAWSSLLGRWDEWLEKNSVDPVHACLNFALSLARVDKVILGVQSASQLASIIAYSDTPFGPELPSIDTDDENLVNPSKWVTA